MPAADDRTNDRRDRPDRFPRPGDPAVGDARAVRRSGCPMKATTPTGGRSGSPAVSANAASMADSSSRSAVITRRAGERHPAMKFSASVVAARVGEHQPTAGFFGCACALMGFGYPGGVEDLLRQRKWHAAPLDAPQIDVVDFGGDGLRRRRSRRFCRASPRRPRQGWSAGPGSGRVGRGCRTPGPSRMTLADNWLRPIRRARRPASQRPDPAGPHPA